MAESVIPAGVQKLWSVWNIRGFVILSLFIQVFLASIARVRKKSNNRFIVFAIWSAYFMADWAATFTFGLISNARCNNSNNTPEVDENLMAFWAAFLLIHLGGPDMITAFSLEDNALWTRHLVGLVAQLFTFFYIFLKTLPDNKLVVPTILIAVAGAIKYGERTRALYLASMENLKKSIEKKPADNIRIANPTIKEAFDFFQIFKGLVVDIAPNHNERSRSREFILSVGAREAFSTIVIELDLLYELFYTKILAVNSPWGILARTIAYYNVIAALILFCLSKKEGFHEVDIWITYSLMASVIALETLSGVMLGVSHWSSMEMWYHYACILAQGLCFIIPGMVVFMVVRLVISMFPDFMGKSWCKKLGAFDLLSHCFTQCWQGDNKLNKYARTFSRFISSIPNGQISMNPFDSEIWDFIFQELKVRTEFADDVDKVKTVFEARGGWTLTNLGNNPELMQYVNLFNYDRSLLVWHVATKICCTTAGAVNDEERKQQDFAKMFSDYMNYLLIKKPERMSTVAGIGHIRYGDTCSEITDFCREFKSGTMNDFCTRLVDKLTSSDPAQEYSKKGTSVLFDACNLAKALSRKDKKWEIISGVWVEMLMYAASHCRPEKHAQALVEGGEFLTIVWLFMAHMGISPHFPYPEGSIEKIGINC